MIHTFLARTHHVRSLRKLEALRKAADRHAVSVVFKHGKPGIFYCQGSLHGVAAWSRALKRQRYMGYVLLSSSAGCRTDEAAPLQESRASTTANTRASSSTTAPLQLGTGQMLGVDTVSQFADMMQRLSLLSWWRTSMGFTSHRGIE